MLKVSLQLYYIDIQSPFSNTLVLTWVIPLCLEKTFLSSKMVFSAAALDPEKFSPFHVLSTSYKVVNEHKIGVDVLVPKGLKAGNQRYPLMVRFHGGGLVSKLISSPTFSSFSSPKKRTPPIHPFT